MPPTHGRTTPRTRSSTLVDVFRRRSSTQAEAPDPTVEGADSRTGRGAVAADGAASRSQSSGKGRPTPKRREAERARKTRVHSAPANRKEAARVQRQKARGERVRLQQAMATGDERYLPNRDKGPVRRFCRDYVDSRRTITEYLLPFFVLLLVVMMIPTPATQMVTLYLWLIAIILVPIDLIMLSRRLRGQLRERFPSQSHRGATTYALMRSTQIRKLRMPKPQVKPGDKV